MKALSVFLLFFSCSLIFAADFKTCSQSGFCRRVRRVETGEAKFSIDFDTFKFMNDYVTAEMVDESNDHVFVLSVESVNRNTFHFSINEKSPRFKRFQVSDVIQDLDTQGILVRERSSDRIVLASGTNEAIITNSPFKIDFYSNQVLSATVNGNGLMKFEYLRPKPENSSEIEDGEWEEEFNGFLDNKPYGPEAIALDFTFPEAKMLFGLPEHSQSFALPSTDGDSEPFRFWASDIPAYAMYTGVGLYGSVPVVYGHGPERTVGVFWLNAADTWVDVYNEGATRRGREVVNPFTHFMSESGIIDVYVMLGPKPQDVLLEFSDLVGTHPMPALFSLGYHQSRWNYDNESDLLEVEAGFDQYDIPLDALWLDIEYTDGKRYFTWDKENFPDPVGMIESIENHGRRVVLISDPHFKVDDQYPVYVNASIRNLFVTDKDRNAYEGECWPGESSWIDFVNPTARKYYADWYLLENFPEQTNHTGIWNDMNEPAVFSEVEKSMPRDNIHYGGWEHRDLHNQYGFYHTMATFDGVIRRGNGNIRPFVLTRSFFAGSQRYSAVWTGDNVAAWDNLKGSVRMCLNNAIGGVSICGSDVGGFLNHPSDELMGRWYQSGAFIPFFRSHCDNSAPRREPWLFPERTRLIIREAIRTRYSFIPYWYTLFYEHERVGLPVMRPLLMEYPEDEGTYALDEQYLLGDKLLVRPVLSEGVDQVQVYFPSNADNLGDFWYDIVDYERYGLTGYMNYSVDDFSIPVFQRGGTIIPKKENIRRSAVNMRNDPYTLVVALDRNQMARGTLFMDDEESYNYRNGNYVYLEFLYKNNLLSTRIVDEQTANYQVPNILEKVVLAGLEGRPISATLNTHGVKIERPIILDGNVYVVPGPNVLVGSEWSIKINY